MNYRIILFGFLFFSFLATGALHAQSTKSEPTFYGSEISEDGAIPAQKLIEALGKQDSMYVKVKGKAITSCKVKGCWMKVKLNDQQDMRVTFKDYAFFVPKGMADEEVVIEGIVKKTTTDVATLQHYAKDEGKSEEEIKKIKKPRAEYTFEAVGVIVK